MDASMEDKDDNSTASHGRPDSGGGKSQAQPDEDQHLHARRLTQSGGNCSARVAALQRSNQQLQSRVDALQRLLTVYKRQAIQAPPNVDDLRWTFSGSIFFALQVMSTVGYGTFTPQTDGGKAAAVCFGTFGIVVTGFSLGVATNAIDAVLERCHHRLLRAAHPQAPAVILFKVAATLLLILAYVCAVGGFAAWDEGWSFGNGIYFVFITVSTIGLGDYTMSADGVGRALLQAVLFFPGLALFAQLINLGTAWSSQLETRSAEAIRHLSVRVFSQRNTNSQRESSCMSTSSASSAKAVPP